MYNHAHGQQLAMAATQTGYPQVMQSVPGTGQQQVIDRDQLMYLTGEYADALAGRRHVSQVQPE